MWCGIKKGGWGPNLNLIQPRTTTGGEIVPSSSFSTTSSSYVIHPFLRVSIRIAAGKIEPHAHGRIIDGLEHKRQRRPVQVTPRGVRAQPDRRVEVVRGALGRVQRAELEAALERDGHVALVLDKSAQVVDAQSVAFDVAVDVGR